MRERFRFFSFSAAAMLLLPTSVLLHPPAEADLSANSESSSSRENNADTPVYSVYMTKTGTVETVSVRDYLIGAVAAEMPASYEAEALKAQVIASHTYAERISAQNAQSPDESLCGADFSDDSSSYQAFYTEAQLHTLWGDDFFSNYEKITAAVDAVGELILYYDDAPIIAAFHAVSAGATESSALIWGADLPYLVSVPSEGDVTSPLYETVTEYTEDTVRDALTAARQTVTFSDNPAEWFSVLSVSDAGTVLSAAVGSEVWTGQQLRDALSLRSACFMVTYEAGSFQFITKGYGHSVGMSQYGANQMASAGSTCAEILAHYYPGTELRNAESM